MGDMADMALDMCAQHEAEWDDYVCGRMSDYDAYEAGIIDTQGCAETSQLNRVIARNPLPTRDNLDNQLSHAIKDLNATSFVTSSDIREWTKIKPKFPTCNCCKQSMKPRHGKYGKFYYCENSCKGQKCVSDKYWQTVR